MLARFQFIGQFLDQVRVATADRDASRLIVMLLGGLVARVPEDRSGQPGCVRRGMRQGRRGGIPEEVRRNADTEKACSDGADVFGDAAIRKGLALVIEPQAVAWT